MIDEDYGVIGGVNLYDAIEFLIYFDIDPRVGQYGVDTILMGNNLLCREAVCSSFSYITCKT